MDIDFSFSSQGKDNNPKHPDHVKKKSQRKKKRNFERRNLFEKKVDKSNMSLQLSDDSNTKSHTSAGITYNFPTTGLYSKQLYFKMRKQKLPLISTKGVNL